MYTFEFKLTKEDYIAVNKKLINEAKGFKISFGLLKYSVPILLIAMPILIGIPADLLFYVVYFGFSFLWISFFPRYMNRSIEKRLAKMLEKPENAPLFVERTVTIKEEGVHGVSGDKEDFYDWNKISRIDIDSGYLYVFLTTSQAIVIPRKDIELTEAAYQLMVDKKFPIIEN
jgi:hypothetical protein